MNNFYKNVDINRWQSLSLATQIGNIGSEFNRIVSFKKKGYKEQANNAFDRAIYLIDLTIADKRWSGRINEISRLREVICDWFVENNSYQISPDILREYFLLFAIKSQSERK